MLKFKTANDAFHNLYWRIKADGVDFANTKALFNVGFEIQHPKANAILNDTIKRNWSVEYAEAEWQWYLSGDRNIKKLGELYGKVPAIWKRMADKFGYVNSNYGWQWERTSQLDIVIQMLKDNPETRQAVQFTVINDKLNMCVVMRSNDLWYGFCNDQYQFANLQMLVAERSEYDVGTYYHFAHNLHLYNDKL